MSSSFLPLLGQFQGSQSKLPNRHLNSTSPIPGARYEQLASEALEEGFLYGLRDQQFLRFDVVDATHEPLGSTDRWLTAVALDHSGIVYGAIGSGTLYRMDPTQGHLEQYYQLYEEDGHVTEITVLDMVFQSDSRILALTSRSFWRGGYARRLVQYDLEDNTAVTLNQLYREDGDGTDAPEGTVFGHIASVEDQLFLTDDLALYRMPDNFEAEPEKIGTFQLEGWSLVDLFSTSGLLYGIFRGSDGSHQLSLINTTTGHALTICSVPEMKMALSVGLPQLVNGVYWTPEKVDFLKVPQGHDPRVKQIAITNWSDEVQPVPDMPVLDPRFTISAPSVNELEPGETLTLDLTFQPDVAGAFATEFDQFAGDGKIEIIGESLNLAAMEEDFGVLTYTTFGPQGFVTSIYKVDTDHFGKELLGTVKTSSTVTDIEMDGAGILYMQTHGDPGKTYAIDLEEMVLHDFSHLPLPEDVTFSHELGSASDVRYQVENQGESALILKITSSSVDQFWVSPGIGPFTIKDFELVSSSQMILLVHPRQQAVQYYRYDLRTGESTYLGEALATNELQDVNQSRTAFDLPRLDALTSTRFNVPNYHLYPNPVDNILRLETQDKVTDVSLVDYLGRERQLQGLRAMGTYQEIPFHQVNPGLYILRIRFASGHMASDRILVR